MRKLLWLMTDFYGRQKLFLVCNLDSFSIKLAEAFSIHIVQSTKYQLKWQCFQIYLARIQSFVLSAKNGRNHINTVISMYTSSNKLVPSPILRFGRGDKIWSKWFQTSSRRTMISLFNAHNIYILLNFWTTLSLGPVQIQIAPIFRFTKAFVHKFTLQSVFLQTFMQNCFFHGQKDGNRNFLHFEKNWLQSIEKWIFKNFEKTWNRRCFYI